MKGHVNFRVDVVTPALEGNRFCICNSVKSTRTMKAFLKNTAFLTSLLTFFSRVNCECIFPNLNTHPAELQAYQKLKPLVGKRFSTGDPDHEYTFKVGICTDATTGNEQPTNEGIIQIKNGDQTKRVIGKYTSAGIMAGTNWIYLEYGEGDSYNSEQHCKKAQRKAVILITCDPTATDSTAMRMLEEQTEMTTGCYYLFELARPEVCENAPSSATFLSIGSIILIIFVCVAAVYLIAGALYQRFVLGAKGIEQIPNYEFWKDFGNLQADGCEFVCRSADARHSSPYKGLGDDQLDEPEERDDNLLPM